jgi:oxaloacetate decarboxylase (Na+ extruding) subunit gamma
MDLFRQAFTIMTIGMGLVFLFLLLVILSVQAAAAAVRRLAPPEPEATPGAMGAAAHGEKDNGGIVAAIAAALHEHEHGKR